MDTPQIYFYRNDTLVELKGLKDELSEPNVYINNATVTVVAKDDAGVELVGQVWPLTLNYVTASKGVYRGILEAALDVAVGDRITVEVTIDGGSGLEGFFEIPVKVRQRGKVYY